MSSAPDNAAESIVWDFGGLTAQWPLWAILMVWLAAGGIGVGLIWWSYRVSLVALPVRRRILLCTLRGVLWSAVLLLLAAPVRVRRFVEEPVAERPLAVLIDRSDSMTTPDNRQRRRIDDALRRWREVEPAAQRAHRGLQLYSFADDVKLASSENSAPPGRTTETRLYDALSRVLAEAPPGGWAGVATLTDGLDTSGAVSEEGIERTTRAALAKSTALYFVPGRNRYARGEYFMLRDFRAPARSTPRSTFRVEAQFDGYQNARREVPVELWVDGRLQSRDVVKMEAGRRLSAWSAEVAAGSPGRREVEVRASGEIARASVRIHASDATRILYYQGALDWSYRFLVDVLRDDPTFVLTPVFSFPSADAILPPGGRRRMPSTREEFEQYDLIVLANVSAAQLNAEQQKALSTWVRHGGVVLFFTPDDDSTQGFAGSELEKMLPVHFGRTGGGTQSLLERGAAVRPGRFAPTVARELPAFAWQNTPRVQEIFADANSRSLVVGSPVFQEYATVARAKPGADVLARHPEARGAEENAGAILLAIQRYGGGQSAVLTTDALWRWKLTLPSGDKQPAIFWQSLFAWLTREKQSGLRFENAPRFTQVERDYLFHVAGAKALPLTVNAESMDGDRMVLASSGAEGTLSHYQWRVPKAGFWHLTARDAKGEEAHHWFTARRSIADGEDSGAPPNEELLRTLAARTGGSVLESSPPAVWMEAKARGGALLGEQRVPLWHHTWTLVALFTLYAAELLLRRFWKML